MIDQLIREITLKIGHISDVATEAKAGVQTLTNDENHYVQVCQGYVDSAEVSLEVAKEAASLNDIEGVEGAKNVIESYLLAAIDARDKAIIQAARLKHVDVEPIHGTVTTDDVEVDSPSFVLEKEPYHGKVTLNLDGTYEYIPNREYTGTDIIIYSFKDGDDKTYTRIEKLEVNL